MIRKGKIARLPRGIREELNERLDNGEPGVALIAWLNELPAVKEVLQQHFEGKPINDVNLTEWKQGGFVDWQTQRDMLAMAKEFNEETAELEDVCGSKLTDRLKTVVAVRYAALLRGWNGEMTDEMRSQLRGMKSLTREIVRLRRSDQEVEQMKLEREALELQKQESEEGIRKKFEEWAAETDFQEKITPKMTKEEKSRALYRLIYGKDKEEVEREKAEAKAKLKSSKLQAPSSNEANNIEGQKVAEESKVHPPSSDPATSSPTSKVDPSSAGYGPGRAEQNTGTGAVRAPAGGDPSSLRFDAAGCATMPGYQTTSACDTAGGGGGSSADSSAANLNQFKPIFLEESQCRTP